MLVIENILESNANLPGVVLTIGSFDGVHRGHQTIINQVVTLAREKNSIAAVLTFRPHPREYFSPGHAPNLLTNDAQKVKLLEQLGIQAVFFLPFNAAVAQMDAEKFIYEVIHRRCQTKVLVVGHDFRFGSNARGDYELLKQLEVVYGYEVIQVPPLLIQGERVSSTEIRERILEGDLAQAEFLLGRKYTIVGEVKPGRGIGKTLGFPTANIVAPGMVIPANGVYAAEARLNENILFAAVNIGIAPTIRHDNVVIEAHLLDFDGELSAKTIELIFHYRLRPERKFPTREALISQIQHDVQEIRDYFSGRLVSVCTNHS